MGRQGQPQFGIGYGQQGETQQAGGLKKRGASHPKCINLVSQKKSVTWQALIGLLPVTVGPHADAKVQPIGHETFLTAHHPLPAPRVPARRCHWQGVAPRPPPARRRGSGPHLSRARGYPPPRVAAGDRQGGHVDLDRPIVGAGDGGSSDRLAWGGGPQLVVSCLPLSHAIGLLHPPDGWLTGGAIAPFVGRVLVVGWKQISERDQINHHGHT